MKKLKYPAVMLFCALMMSYVCAKDGTINLTVKNNSIFSITLRSNPTTGYSWKIAKISPPLTVKNLSSEYLPDNTVLAGSGGQEVWKFKALKCGNTSVTFSYQRPWEKNIPPVEKRQYLIKVKP